MDLNLGILAAIILGVVPGLPGESLYRLIAGSTWREDSWGRLFRIVSFSLAGFVLYVLLVPILGLPEPTHLTIATQKGAALNEAHLLAFAATTAGQFVGGTCAALLAGIGVRILARWSPVMPFSDTWDRFVREYIPEHWIVVRLLDGSAYAGILRRADISVPVEERDIVLAEPAEWQVEQGVYLSLPHQFLYLPGTSLASVAVVHDAAIDTRLSPVGGRLFTKEINGERNESHQVASSDKGHPDGRRQPEAAKGGSNELGPTSPTGGSEGLNGSV